MQANGVPFVRELPAGAAIAQAQSNVEPVVVACRHTPPSRLAPGQPLPLMLTGPSAGVVRSIVCRYRHVNQAERFEQIAMTSGSTAWWCAIPASYTASPYPLQYYFVVSLADGRDALYPGLGREWLGTPYFVVRLLARR
jgi:hypothetical protein